MAPLLELQRDKSFRLRLMLTCFGVAFLVSVIYVVVSYRLSTDLGVQAELESLNRQAILFHTELIKSDHSDQTDAEHSAVSDNVEEHLISLVERMYLNKNSNAKKLYIETKRKDFTWAFSYGIKASQKNRIKQDILDIATKRQHPLNINGKKEFDSELFLWQVIEEQGSKVIIIEVANSIDSARSLVAKRLSITSFFVFWLTAWLAILLSSWMNKKVQSKNDALTRLATYDSLTGLPNRLYLSDQMQQFMSEKPSENASELEHSSLLKDNHGCLFVIDLDKFKEVNDAFGHSAGDDLLKKVSSRLMNTLDNKYTLARIGGDEFIVWAANLELKKAILLAKELVSVCNQPVIINKLAVNTGASIGVAHYPTHATNIESLMLCADVAMYEAKQQRSGYSVFNERNSEKNRQRLHLRADLSEALTHQQIQLYYQPKVRLRTGKIIGVEALARWHHPKDGILYPDSFIDLIEQSGRVQEFGRYIASEAIKQLAEWQKQGIYTPISINLSPYNLLDIGLLNFILKLLDDLKISPNMLEIELIESATSLNIEQISYRLNKFKEAGIKLSIDDFGTGMSSLSYISNLSVSFIKIDRSFVDDMEFDVKKQAVVSTAITLAKSFGTKLLAEGVENKAQADLLIEMGCRYGQGYYYGKPICAEDMKTQLIDHYAISSKPTLPTE